MTKSTPNPSVEASPALPRNLTIWLVAAAAGLLLVILLVMAVSRPAPTPAVNATPFSAIVPDPIGDSSEAERRALAKAELQRLQTEGQETRRLLDDGEQELAAWDREVDAELTGKRGRSVAADKESLERFSAVYRQSRPSKTELEACRNRVGTLLEPVTAALASGALHVPSGDTNSKLSTERQFAQAAQQSFRDARQNVLSVFTDAERKGTTGTQTLKDALAELEARQTQARVNEITARHEAAQREATKMLADARAEQELQYGRDEAARVAQETRRELEKRRAEDTRKDAETAQLALVERAKDPRVRAKYKPFLDKGKFRPRSFGEYERLETPQPMSYTDLKTFGVLNDFKNFARAGAGWWGNYHMTNHIDRLVWPNPASDEDFDQYRERFQEFCELAPIWAKDGTLNP